MVEDALRVRANELKGSGPGRVSVSTIHDIAEVRVLREATAVLSDDEQAQVSTSLDVVRDILRGVETSVGPAPVPKKKGFLRALISPIAAGASKDAREAAEWQQMATAAGGPAELEAPEALIKAAEAWAIGTLAEGRTEENLEVLRRPWLEATVSR